MQYNYSVIIPYRDKYDMLVTAVKSVPDREDIQIIIIDNSEVTMDGDKVPQKEKAHVDFLTSSPTKGAGCARNVGLGSAKGKFLLFLDADDYFTPEAFVVFDKYLDTDYDIVYFKADSIHLKDGKPSTRNKTINRYIDNFLNNNDEKPLRYCFVNPVCKMIRTAIVFDNNILFDETKVANDAMFSSYTGHYANKIGVDPTAVYMITEDDGGRSLTKMKNKENMFIRFQVAVRRYQFVVSVGRKDQRPRLLGFIRMALLDFGLKEAYRYWKYARENKVGIF